MKLKIVIGVQMNCDKCRSQAMKIAAKHGATEVTIEGDNKLVVVGNEIDSVSLTCCLRKKFQGNAKIINQQEVKEKEDKKKGVDGKNSTLPICLPCPLPPQPYFIVQEVPYQSSGCSIL